VSYTIEREDAERDLDALRDVINSTGPGYGSPQRVFDVLRELADSIEEQLPKVEEPTELWSVIWANVAGDHFIEPKQLVRTTVGWLDADGNEWGDFASFSDVEVLRVGIGESPGDAYARGYEDGVESNLPSPVDFSNINSAIREEIAKISLREGRLIGEDHSYELAKAAMKAMS
jgi:hypothetical protein